MSRQLDARIVVDHGDAFHLDVELAVDPAETVVLIGPNGAGKSTIVAAIAGIRPLDGGHIRLGEHVLDDPSADVFVRSEDRGVGVVFQDRVLFPHLTALDNVAFGLESRGDSKAIARTEAEGWLGRLGVGEVAGARPAALSGGQAQRVALARALVTEPGLLVLDEPLAALDAAARVKMRRILGEYLALFSGPRLVITHDPTEALLLADRIVVVEDGAVVQWGTPDDIRRSPQTQYVADLVGVNLVRGRADHGEVDVGADPPIHLADRSVSGEILMIIHPRMIALYGDAPHGSPRNTWRSSVAVLEPLGDRTRVQLGSPHPMTAELTSSAVAELALEPGREVWVAIKATEIEVQSA